MKLKFSGKAVTCKISEAEMQRLQSGGSLQESVPLQPLPLTIRVVPEGSSLALTFTANHDAACLNLAVPATEVAALATLGKSRDGISVTRQGLELTLQVDIRTDKRRCAAPQERSS